MPISSKQYSWSDTTIAYGGRILEGITGFEYTEKQEKEPLYGRGNKPHKIMAGNKSYEGKLMLWQSEVEAMIADAPNNDILSLEFEVAIAHVPNDGGQTVVDIWAGVQVTELPKGMNQGDKNRIIELPVIFLDLKRQA